MHMRDLISLSFMLAGALLATNLLAGYMQDRAAQTHYATSDYRPPKMASMR